MSIKVESTSEKPEVVVAAGDVAPVNAEVSEKSASGEISDETAADSDAAEGAEVDETEADESESEKDQAEEVRPKKKSGFKRRIDKLTARATAAEQEREYWRTEALKNKPEPVKANEKPESTGRPNADKFDTHEEYVEALADWKVDQKLSARDAKAKESELKSDFEKQIATHHERVNKFAKSHADFEELMEDVNDVPMSVTVQEVILGSDNGPELMYELAKNKEEFKRICALSPLAAARELGKFEAKFKASSESSQEILKTTKAPTPIKPVGSQSTGSTKKSIFDPSLSQEEYERLRREQRAKKA